MNGDNFYRPIGNAVKLRVVRLSLKPGPFIYSPPSTGFQALRGRQADILLICQLDDIAHQVTFL